MTTMNDVARLSGVSVSTVSRVLSGKVFVDAETKSKVMKAIEKLDYRPNLLAQGLKGGGTKTVALIMPNICNPSFPKAARGAEDAARKRGYVLVTCNTDENIELEKQYVNHMRNRFIDGMIFATITDQSSHVIALQEEGYPVVQLMRYHGNHVNSVHTDNFAIGYMGTKHLLRCGCRRVANLCGDNSMLHLRLRFEGFRKALEKAGVRYIPELVEPMFLGDDNGIQAASRLFDKGLPFDGLLCSNDFAALGAMQVARERGLCIPEDLKICGVDNLDFSAFTDPPLTTVEQPLYEMGYEACEMLMNIIEGKQENRNIETVLAPRIVQRKTAIIP